MYKLRNIFIENTPFKVFLISILITSISYGLYKGMLDSLMTEIAGILDLIIMRFSRFS